MGIDTISRLETHGGRAAQTAAVHPAAVRAKVRALRKFAVLLDSAVRIPGTQQRIGLDSILGLIPGIGDAVTALLSAYIISEASRLGVPRWTLLKMLGNLGFDFLVGVVPLLGDLFDVAFRANIRNADLLENYLATRPEFAGTLNQSPSLHSRGDDWK